MRRVDADSPVISPERKSELLSQYADAGSNRIKQRPRAALSALLENVNTQHALVTQFESGVREYARDNMNQVGSGDHYTTEEVNIGSTEQVAPQKKYVKAERVKAVNLLLEMFKSSSAHDIYQYVSTPKFLALVGSHEKKLNIFHAHLSAHVNGFIRGYEAFLQVSSSELVIHALLDNDISQFITNEQLYQLLTSYNCLLVADIIVNDYRREYFTSRQFHGQAIDYPFLQRLLFADPTAVEIMNGLLKDKRARLLFDDATLVAGKNTLYEEQLAPHELYQYEDLSIFAVENWLQAQYRDMMLNVHFGMQSNVPLREDAPYYFYLLSTAKYIIPAQQHRGQDDRFNELKKDLRSLIASLGTDQLEHRNVNRPVIVTFIINYDGVHYVPCFIHRAEDDRVSVLTLDPSARTYSDQVLATNSRLEDDKVKTVRQLHSAFWDIFPDCHYVDADVAQMLRQRDCGPNAATTIHDAFRTACSAQPLLYITEDGELHLDPNQLTVHAEPTMIDPYTLQLRYPATLDQDSLANREVWRQRFSVINRVQPYTALAGGNHSRGLRFDDVFSADQPLLNFDYALDVVAQQQQDAREVNLSALHTLLLSSEAGVAVKAGIIEEFGQRLRTPSESAVVKFVTESVDANELVSLASAHRGDVRALCKDLVILMVKDKIPATLIRQFEETVLNQLPERYDLDAQVLVSTFLEQNREIFNGLTIYQQRDINGRILTDARDAVMDKLVEMHLSKFKPYHRDALSFVVRQLKVSDVSPERQAIEYYKTFPEIRETVEFLELHHQAVLIRYMRDEVNRELNKTIDTVTDYLAQWFATQFQSLEQIVGFLDKVGIWTLSELKRSLPEDFPYALPESGDDSIMALRVLQAVNSRIANIASQRLNLVCDHAVSAFIDSLRGYFEENHNALLIMEMTEAVYKYDNECDLAIVSLLKKVPAGHLLQTFLKNDLTSAYLTVKLRFATRNLLDALKNDCLYTIAKDLFLMAGVDTYYKYESVFLLNSEVVSNYIRLSNRLVKDGRYDEFDCKHGAILNHLDFSNMFHQFLNSMVDHFGEGVVTITRIMALTREVDIMAGALKEAERKQLEGEPTIEVIDGYVETIFQVGQMQLFENQQSSLSRMEEQVRRHAAGTAELAFRNRQYKKGSVKAGEFTVIARSNACRLLGIPCNAVLTSRMASEIDSAIAAAIESGRASLDKIPSDPELLVLPVINELPDTYGKPLTREIVIQCIAFWQLHGKAGIWSEEPAIIAALIRVVNENLTDEYGEVSGDGIHLIKQALGIRQAYHKNQLKIYASSKLEDRISSVLCRTSSVFRANASQIEFSVIARLFNLPVNMTEVVEPGQEQIQTKVREIIRDNMARGVPVDMQKIQREARIALGGSTNGPAAPVELTSVQRVTLPRATGFFSSLTAQGRMNEAEKCLMLIRDRHEKTDHFYLDDTDITLLRRLMSDRWHKLLSQHGNEAAAIRVYIATPGRSDHVYIALAEMIAKHLRSQKENICVVQLLMPGSQRYSGVTNIRNYSLHNDILAQLGFHGDDSHFDELIGLRDLVITQAGHVLSMPYIINLYGTKKLLVNPYTGRDYTPDEIRCIMMNEKSDELFTLVKANAGGAINEKVIDILTELINGAFFKSGLRQDYNAVEQKLAERAYAKFYDRLGSECTSAERKALLNETIPGSDATYTVNKVLKDSASSCLTIRCKYLAKVVIAYRGKNNHGLPSSIIAAMQADGSYNDIPDRKYISQDADQNDLSVAENCVLGNIVGEMREVRVLRSH